VNTSSTLKEVTKILANIVINIHHTSETKKTLDNFVKNKI
jgi:hypothetical protein